MSKVDDVTMHVRGDEVIRVDTKVYRKEKLEK